MTRASALALVLASFAPPARGSPIVAVAGVIRDSDHDTLVGARLDVELPRRISGAITPLVSLDILTGYASPHASGMSLRVGLAWDHPVGPLAAGVAVHAGIDGENFPGDSGYTDGAIYPGAAGGQLRLTYTSGQLFTGVFADADYRPFSVGNKRGYDGYLLDAAIVLGVRM